MSTNIVQQRYSTMIIEEQPYSSFEFLDGEALAISGNNSIPINTLPTLQLKSNNTGMR